MSPWIRALLAVLLAVDRVVARAHGWEASLRDELLWGIVPPGRREELTAAIYARQAGYAPGGARFEAGLFEWEQRLLAHPCIPSTGRVLLGGAGGGRELASLGARGYEVTAFEPCAPLAQAAEAVAARFPGSRVLVGAYRDLAAAVEGEGPLASLAGGGPYALVVAGWRSLSHVLDADERRETFRAFARLAPAAPILISFLPRTGVPPAGRVARALRRGATMAGGAPPPHGAAFIPWAGFAVALDRAEMERLAHASDRELLVCEMEGEGVALFVPR